MLTFLRNIRRSLLKIGATRKYFLYAVGEFILIVAGILVAMQINNWNEWRIANKTEIQVLKKLMRDLDADQTQFNKLISNYQQQMEQMREFKHLFRKAVNNSEDVRKMMTFLGVVFRDINPRSTAYNEMINSGNMYKLSDETLLEEIINYYQELDNAIYQVRQDRLEFRATMFGPHLTDYWTFYTDEDNIREQQATVFFKNKDSQAFKILKQTSGWSVLEIEDQINGLSKLLDQNKTLSKNIQEYLELKG